MEFKNLKLLSQISDDHGLKILQINMSWEMMKNFMAYYSPPANYQGLKSNLIKIGQGDAYLKAIYHPMFNQPFCPYVPTLSTPACQLPQGTPMEVDHAQ